MPQLEPTAWSTRAQVVYRRSYSRPLDVAGTEFETWEQTIDRVIRHQRWLWERAKGKDLNGVEREELDELKALMLDRKGYLAGRTLWLGGTELSRTRESCSFNCAGLRIKTVFDVVDALWLLLQGVGVGFTPVMGVLNGFTRQIPEIEVIRSDRKIKGGSEWNTETWLSDSKTWILQIGDSAKAWSKAVGKLIAGKYPAKKLVIDLSQIRPAGDRLRGYGWISSGDEQLSKAIVGICAVLNHAAGRLLTVIDILDVMNWLGSILSSRRSAELALLPSNHPSWREFALAKKNHFEYNPQRAQSNNSLVFYEKPSKSQLFEIFDLMLEGGGSEPGIMNGEEALRRAPYFSAFNPSLRGNTRLVTSLGIVPIADLEGQSFEVKNLYGEWKPATCWLSGHDKTLWKIKLRGGHEIYATKEHKWPVMIDNQVIKVATCDLQKGHRLPNLESDVLFEGHEGCYDEGFFCGWVFGDGWITERKDDGTFQLGMTVAEVDADVMPILQRFLKRLGSEAVFKKNKSCAAYELCTTLRGLTQVLQRYGMLEHRKNGLPKMLFTTASEDFRRGFIDGLVSADGGIGKTEVGKKERGGLGFTTCHQQVAQDFSDLLGFYGIQTKVSGGKLKHIPTFPNGKVYDRSYESYLVKIRIHSSLVRFQEVFKLSASRKQRLLELAVTLQTGPRDPANYRHPNTFVDVMSVEKTDIKEDVWDIRVEDDTHCFQLAHCITGNCAEILLGDKGFCNLCELVLPKFNGDFDGACRAITLLARANYRQTCVNLDDGVLQRTWHELNEYLHLCGVGLTGIVEWDRQTDKTAYQALRAKARAGADSMALELDLPYAELVTTTKPSGTLSKISDCTEGVHKPLGRFIFNNINFSKHDPLIPILQAANYNVFENPYDSTGVLVTFPVEYSNVKFTQVDGKWVNLESAVTQLERYRLLMENYIDHNVSCTISYAPGEVGQIVDWLHAHWDSYVATAFMFRNDPTKTAEDMGYPYLPQEVVEEEKYRAYVATLLPIDLIDAVGHFEIDSQECRSGMCPIK